MYRLTYSSYSFTEGAVEQVLRGYGEREDFNVEVIRHGGTLGVRLGREDAVIDGVLLIRQKKLYLDLDVGDRRELVNGLLWYLVDKGLVCSSLMDYSDCPRECEGRLGEALVKALQNGQKIDTPLVYLSSDRRHIGYGFELDEYSLARRLRGVAHVMLESRDETERRVIHRAMRARGMELRGGGVHILFPGGVYNFLIPPSVSNRTYKAEDYIVMTIFAELCKGAEVDRLSFDKLKVNVAIEGRTSGTDVDDRAEWSKELTKETERLRKYNSRLIAERDEARRCLDEQKKLTARMMRPTEPMRELMLPDIPEGRVGEFVELVVSAIRRYGECLPPEYKRTKQICEAFLLKNPASTYEETMLDEIGQAFRDGRDPRAVMHKYHIEYVRQGKHQICNYQGISQPLSRTPSDCRSRDNELSNIKRSYCVCL